MPRATIPGGELENISKCYIVVPVRRGALKIELNNLPDITDSKSASYNDEPVIGRSFPLKTFSHSENRTISMQLHFFVVKQTDVVTNLFYLRLLESAVYPREDASSGAPFVPPPVCRIKCGLLLADSELCVVLKSYSVKFPTDVAWDSFNFTPYKFDVDTTWEVVYRSEALPGQERIFESGR